MRERERERESGGGGGGRRREKEMTPFFMFVSETIIVFMIDRVALYLGINVSV